VRVQVVVLPFLAGLLIATVLAAPVRWLRGLGAPPALAALLAVFAGIVVLLLAGFLIGWSVAGKFHEITSSVTRGIDEVEEWAKTGPLNVNDARAEEFRRDLQKAQTEAEDWLVRGVEGELSQLTRVGTELLLTVVFVFFLVKDGEAMWRWALHWLPPARRPTVDGIGQSSWRALAAYVYGTTILAAVNGLIVGLAFWAFGVALAFPLAVLTFFLTYIPILGIVVAGAVAVLVAAADGGLGEAIAAAAIIVALIAIGAVLHPYVLGKAVKLHPLAVLAAVTAGSTVAGIPGAILAAPFVAVVVQAAEQLRRAPVET
jgi:predicted PurR-regulated permease PerM